MSSLVVLSGGLDSTVALALEVAHLGPENVRAVGFRYGQKHSKELEQARKICERLGVEFLEIETPRLKSESLVEGGEEIPTGDYDESNMSSTVVQGRNLLFASLAVAQCEEGDLVVLGVHGGDHALYGDCRPEFWIPVSEAVYGAYRVRIALPFLDLTKDKIVRLGAVAGVSAPFELTWSCYVGGEKHCGKCGTCRERREAFKLANVPDPTEYEETP